MLLGFAVSADAQVIEIYRTTMSGEEVVPPSGQPGVALLDVYFPEGGPCSGDENGTAQICISYWDLSGDPIDLRLDIGMPGENGDTGIVLTTFGDQDPEPCLDVQVDWPECDYWLDERVYVVITTAAYPEGELRGQLVFVPQPTIEASWGSVKQHWRAMIVDR
jgi:hypothetical protein